MAKGSGSLAQGDAARLVRAGSPKWTAGPDGSEVLIWQTQVQLVSGRSICDSPRTRSSRESQIDRPDTNHMP